MKTALTCIAAFAIVYGVSWLLSLYMRAKPWDQPEPTKEPHFTRPASHIGRQLADYIRMKMQGKG